MAQVKISNLPSISQYDSGAIIATVDSGSTTTSKIKVVDLFRASGQTLISDSSLILASSGYAGGSQINSGDYNAIIGGDGGIITNSTDKSVVLGSQRASGGQTPTIDGSTHCLLGATFRNTKIEGNSERSAIIADEDSKINQGYMNFIAGCNSTQFGVYAGGGYKIVGMGSGNGSIDSATEAAVIASRDFSAHLQGSNTALMLGSKSPTIENVSANAEVTSIIGSKSSSIYANAHTHTILNSDSVSIDDRTSTATQNATIINSWGGFIKGASAGSNYQKLMMNGYSTEFTGGGSRHASLNTNDGGITSSGDMHMLLNTENVTISGSTNKVTMIGVWDASHSDEYSNTVHTDHLLSFGQLSNGHYDNGSGSTFTLDFDEGNTQEFHMTGNTSLTFSNVRNGATYKLKVSNGGTHTISSVTASGFTILCEGGSIPNITNNGIDLCVLEVVGTNIMVRHFADFSEPS